MPSTVVAIETPNAEEVLVNSEPVPAERQKQLFDSKFEPDSLFDKLNSDRRWAFVGFVRDRPVDITVGDTILLTNRKAAPDNNIIELKSPGWYRVNGEDGLLKVSFSTLEKKYVIANLVDLRKLSREERRYWGKAYRLEHREYNRREVSSAMADRQKQLYVTVGIPFISIMNYVPPVAGRKEVIGGLFGVSAGVEYFYIRAMSVAAGFEFVSGFSPFTDEYNPEPRKHAQINIYLANNVHFWKFSLGYGLNFSNDKWRYTYNLTPDFIERNPDYENYTPKYPFRQDVMQRYWALGFNFNLNYNFAPFVRLGVVYRPTFWRLNARYPNVYEHSLSLELKFLINTRKPFLSTGS